MIKKTDLINIDKDFNGAVELAGKLFFAGSFFIYPTDTIYGFGANPFNSDGVNGISEIKGREKWKRYILLIGNVDDLQKYVELNSEKHLDYLISIWPNPVSVVLKLNNKTRELLGAETAAFRIPNHRFCLKLLESVKMPMVSTSVNRSGQEPIIEPSLIKEEFDTEVPAIFYSEKKSLTVASTIINLSDSEPKLIREGKIKFAELLEKF